MHLRAEHQVPARFRAFSSEIGGQELFPYQISGRISLKRKVRGLPFVAMKAAWPSASLLFPAGWVRRRVASCPRLQVFEHTRGLNSHSLGNDLSVVPAQTGEDRFRGQPRYGSNLKDLGGARFPRRRRLKGAGREERCTASPAFPAHARTARELEAVQKIVNRRL